ncbi:MAG: ATP-dependent Clp protease ATP-binding subunit, partial [Clostridia bacterium]|nr:ATP-dependent Clp protease ATP-binding subunit [Clostridia bacterium]
GFATGSEDVQDKDDEDKIRQALKETFRPEFLNRLDEIIVFHRLSRENICAICRKMLAEVADRVRAQEIEISFTDEVVEKLAEEGFDPVYGARPLRRAVQRSVEDGLSSRLLDGTVKAGDRLTARLNEAGEIVYDVA